MATDGERTTGTVKCYLPLKGFGFIKREKGKDVFFLFSDAESEDALQEEAVVSFLLKQEARGPRAYDIRRIG